MVCVVVARGGLDDVAEDDYKGCKGDGEDRPALGIVLISRSCCLTFRLCFDDRRRDGRGSVGVRTCQLKYMSIKFVLLAGIALMIFW